MEIQNTARSPVRQLAQLRKPITVMATLLALAALTSTAHAGLVTNGSFEISTASTTTTFLYAGVSAWTNSDIGEALVLPSWYTNGYLFPPNVGLAGPFPQTSPDGGNFVLSDGDYRHSPIQQTITGLIPGDSYQLSFDQALAQDTEPYVTIPGPVTGQWEVSLGTSVQYSPMMYANGAPTPFISPWQSETMTFTAQNATETLSFFSIGTGEPPMVGLDGVSLVPTPEPGVIWLMGLAAVLFGWKLTAHRKAPAAHHD